MSQGFIASPYMFGAREASNSFEALAAIEEVDKVQLGPWLYRLYLSQGPVAKVLGSGMFNEPLNWN